MEKVKIRHLQKGDKAILVGEVAKKDGKTASKDPYINLKVSDNTGSVSSNVWSNLPLYTFVKNELENGDYVEVEVTCTKVGQYINVDYHSVKKVEKIEEQVVDLEAIKAELRSVLKEFKDEHLRQLVCNVFNRSDVKEAFWTAPASTMSGYSFDGGLASHVVRLVRLSKAVADVFNSWEHNVDQFTTKLNVDLLKASAILHDVGKVRTFRKRGSKVEKTMEGELFEDSYISMKMVLEELDKVPLPQEQRLFLEHVLGSSKGKSAYGALYIPRSREAVAFNLIDTLDVQMGNFEYLDRHAGASDEFVQLFQKTFFLGSYDE